MTSYLWIKRPIILFDYAQTKEYLIDIVVRVLSRNHIAIHIQAADMHLRDQAAYIRFMNDSISAVYKVISGRRLAAQ